MHSHIAATAAAVGVFTYILFVIFMLLIVWFCIWAQLHWHICYWLTDLICNLLEMCLVVCVLVFVCLHIHICLIFICICLIFICICLINLYLHLSDLICNLLNMCLVVWGPGWGTLPVMDLLAAREGGGDNFLYLPVFVFWLFFIWNCQYLYFD